MPRPKTDGPTERELAILKILWRGSATVREVHADISKTERVGYTSVLKIMQIMTEKGLVVRDEEGQSHRYHAAASQETTEKAIVKGLLERLFDGSATQLVSRALAAKPATDAELEELEALLERLKGANDDAAR